MYTYLSVCIGMCICDYAYAHMQVYEHSQACYMSMGNHANMPIWTCVSVDLHICMNMTVSYISIHMCI